MIQRIRPKIRPRRIRVSREDGTDACIIRVSDFPEGDRTEDEALAWREVWGFAWVSVPDLLGEAGPFDLTVGVRSARAHGGRLGRGGLLDPHAADDREARPHNRAAWGLHPAVSPSVPKVGSGCGHSAITRAPAVHRKKPPRRWLFRFMPLGAMAR